MNNTQMKVQQRPAQIGDQGTGIGWEPLGSMGHLLIRVSEAEVVFRVGDWRMIRDIADALRGEEVMIVEGEGSFYGCHTICPLDED